MLTPDDWIARGYRKFAQVSHIREYASFGLQKLFCDELGKRYFITVYVYDNTRYANQEYYKDRSWSFPPDCQFNSSSLSKITLNIELILTGDTTIEEVEQQMLEMWKATGSNYCELYGDY